MFGGCNILESLTLKNCTNDAISFLKEQLIANVPDKITSNDFSLILDDGNYNYDPKTSAWKKK